MAWKGRRWGLTWKPCRPVLACPSITGAKKPRLITVGPFGWRGAIFECPEAPWHAFAAGDGVWLLEAKYLRIGEHRRHIPIFSIISSRRHINTSSFYSYLHSKQIYHKLRI
eukprot:scaffold259850_cov20-Prasinocladus_malaysianus.AAC.1